MYLCHTHTHTHAHCVFELHSMSTLYIFVEMFGLFLPLFSPRSQMRMKTLVQVFPACSHPVWHAFVTDWALFACRVVSCRVVSLCILLKPHVRMMTEPVLAIPEYTVLDPVVCAMPKRQAVWFCVIDRQSGDWKQEGVGQNTLVTTCTTCINIRGPCPMCLYISCASFPEQQNRRFVMQHGLSVD